MIQRALERLSPEEQVVLETASVAGAAFSAAAVAAAVGLSSSLVEAYCTGLSHRKQFVSGSTVSEWPDGTIAASYQFLHTFYREVLYERVPAAYRAGLHRRIARREEAAYGQRANEIAAELAHHYEQAGIHDQASKYYQLAGESALRGFASREAEAHFRSALRIIEKTPQAAERDERELKALKGLRVALAATIGIGFAELGTILDRTSELCHRLGRDAELASALHAHVFHSMYVGDMGRAGAIASEALAIASRANDAAAIALSYNALGSAHYWMGLFAESRLELERGLDFDGQDRPARAGVSTAAVTTVVALLLLSRDLWMLGFSDQAQMRDSQCLELAEHTDDPVLVAQAEIFGADISYYCGEVDRVDHRCTEGQRFLLATRSEYPQLIGWSRMLKGWAKAQRGQPLQALSLIRDGFDVILASRNRLAFPIFGCLIAKAQANAGRPSEALLTVEQTLQAADETGQHYSDSELWRLRGEFLLAREDRDEDAAKECFHIALDIARHQAAKSWELRATMSLARLLAKQGRQKEAHSILREIYNWFTEGFDTADLKEARALLGGLDE
jgi:tetratricopeptide (TPR) repeat protein